MTADRAQLLSCSFTRERRLLVTLPEEEAVSNLPKPYSMSHGLTALPDTGWGSVRWRLC